MEGGQVTDSEEARRYVWMGSIPLQIHLHQSEVTVVPAPPPVLVMAPRNGYLPLLVPKIRSQFNNFLPPGADTVWFDYRGLPLKWNIPTGVLFDLLCAEPERPWNLTVHFRNYPTDLLTPCVGEDNVKWSFINCLKEASYVLNGNTRNVMKMSESDQRELWRCVVESDGNGYYRVSAKLKHDGVGEDTSSGTSIGKGHPQRVPSENDHPRTRRTARIPFRLYLRHIKGDLDDLSDASPVGGWDELCYINRPVEIPKDEGSLLTLGNALARLLPNIFRDHQDTIPVKEPILKEPTECLGDQGDPSESSQKEPFIHSERNSESFLKQKTKILIRIQGIEPSLDLPLYWVAQNLAHPEHFIHVSIHVCNT